ncbi:MAG: lysophospholipid acyltransferase family protein [Candidatus Hodarchaeales archaeon]|jgi:1-acyl-sn-glycerol-3-phosphate acyltransferase
MNSNQCKGIRGTVSLNTEGISNLKYNLIRQGVKASALLGYRLKIEGQEKILDNLAEFRESGSIFAGNHESVIDAFLMGLVVPSELREKRIFFLGKKSALWRNQFWGRMMDYFGVIPVKKRGNTDVIKKGISVLEKKQALGLFPEGHIRYSRKELEGKVGVARFAFETESPVIPVGIIGTDGVLPYGGNWPSLGKKVTLKVGDPIYLSYDYDRKDIYSPYALRAATDLIMHEIRVLSQGYGIPPNEAHTLRCMDGIEQVMTPPKWVLTKKKLVKEWNKKKKRGGMVVDSFENWLSSVPQPKKKQISRHTQQKAIIQQHDKIPSTSTTQEFMNWLNDQL